jgi:hypothetical protein
VFNKVSNSFFFSQPNELVRTRSILVGGYNWICEEGDGEFGQRRLYDCAGYKADYQLKSIEEMKS